jgi:dTMP kinase
VSRAIFVTFEGIDGSGKSSQVELLRECFHAQGREVLVLREPGGTALGEQLRELLLNGSGMSVGAEVSLFAAARAELVDKVIRPALDNGIDVICDRYIDSSLVYQGVARDFGVDHVLEWNLKMVNGVMPDRTFVLCLPAEDAVTRMGRQLTLFAEDERRGPPDRLERESFNFRRQVDNAYWNLEQRFPDRVRSIDASLTLVQIKRVIHKDVKALLDRSNDSVAVDPVCS